ncbi:MAG: hypothetical protein ACI9E1_002279, partial [Cryomorphaceae bacterium]
MPPARSFQGGINMGLKPACFADILPSGEKKAAT